MEYIRRILVVSRMSPYSRKAIRIGVSLARSSGAKLYVLHLVSEPVDLMVVNLAGIFPDAECKNYEKCRLEAKTQLDKVIKQETNAGFPIHEMISELDSVVEIERVVLENNIDLIILLAHEEGRIEHALFGGENDAIIRRMPCSILLVKKEPETAQW